MRKYQAQPYRNGGGKPTRARAAMKRGRPAHRRHPMDEKRKIEHRAALLRKLFKKRPR